MAENNNNNKTYFPKNWTHKAQSTKIGYIETHRETDRQTERETDRQTDGYTITIKYTTHLFAY